MYVCMEMQDLQGFSLYRFRANYLPSLSMISIIASLGLSVTSTPVVVTPPICEINLSVDSATSSSVIGMDTLCRVLLGLKVSVCETMV